MSGAANVLLAPVNAILGNDKPQVPQQAPPPPPPPPPALAPAPPPAAASSTASDPVQDPTILSAQQQQVMAAQARSGRQSTILGDASGSNDRLGGG